MQTSENVRQAFQSIRANKLRSSLTLLGIVVGVFSIIGVMTALGALTNSVDESLSQLGANTFTIKKWPSIQMGGGDWVKYMKRKQITYEEIRLVRSNAALALAVSAEHTLAPLTAAYADEKSDPQFYLEGSDDNYSVNHNRDVSAGRMLSADDVQYARDVAVIGQDIVDRIFKHSEDPIGKTIKLNGHNYTVIGVLDKKGGGMGQSQDGFALIPITNELKYFIQPEFTSLQMTVRARSKDKFDETQDEVIGAMRAARGVKPGVDNDFEVEDNTSLTTQFESFSKYLTYAGFGISAIALLAASIGIMNIMLVSVTERTKEIGIRKAMGATKSDITGQFLMEAVVLCEVGGVIGIAIGIGLGNIIAMLIHASVYVPTMWIGIGLGVCSLVGIVFGLYPAMKAANMHPIDALRFE
ncbi:MAG: ABC transporter permease [Bacteroidota bacterium]|nr:ABC transporter permease [Bacteroidota bacterium]MDP4234515.1 ABC transporter permease [Bacteroidota bacterium]MDP4242580.1 ABC transporter permease [Bacteroidota bacterium]MDP4288094.1 ABC transporter permease [Bacteroidota bacterium]